MINSPSHVDLPEPDAALLEALEEAIQETIREGDTTAKGLARAAWEAVYAAGNAVKRSITDNS